MICAGLGTGGEGCDCFLCSAGGFWPKRGSEVAEFLTDLEKVRDSLKARKIRVFVAHKDLLGAPEQQRLRFQ